MKTIKPKVSKGATSSNQTPTPKHFFNKNGEDSFFAKKELTEEMVEQKPFFDIPVPSKMDETIQSKNEQMG